VSDTHDGRDQCIIGCSCAAQCELALITYFEYERDNKHPQFWLEWFVTLRDDAPFRERFTQAWRMLRKKDHWLHSILITKADGRRLSEWLAERTKEEA